MHSLQQQLSLTPVFSRNFWAASSQFKVTSCWHWVPKGCEPPSGVGGHTPLENLKKNRDSEVQSGAFWGLWQQKNWGKFKAGCLQLFYGHYPWESSLKGAIYIIVYFKHLFTCTCKVLHWFQGILLSSGNCLKKNHSMNLSIIPLAKGKLSYTKELLFMIRYRLVSFLHLLKNSR